MSIDTKHSCSGSSDCYARLNRWLSSRFEHWSASSKGWKQSPIKILTRQDNPGFDQQGDNPVTSFATRTMEYRPLAFLSPPGQNQHWRLPIYYWGLTCPSAKCKVQHKWQSTSTSCRHNVCTIVLIGALRPGSQCVGAWIILRLWTPHPCDLRHPPTYYSPWSYKWWIWWFLSINNGCDPRDLCFPSMIFVIRIIIIVKNILIIVLEGTKARIYLCSYYIPWSHLCWRWWGPCFLDLLITVMTIVTYQSQFRWKSQSLTYITYQLKVCLVIQEMSSCPSKKQG